MPSSLSRRCTPFGVAEIGGDAGDLAASLLLDARDGRIDLRLAPPVDDDIGAFARQTLRRWQSRCLAWSP